MTSIVISIVVWLMIISVYCIVVFYQEGDARGPSAVCAREAVHEHAVAASKGVLHEAKQGREDASNALVCLCMWNKLPVCQREPKVAHVLVRALRLIEVHAVHDVADLIPRQVLLGQGHLFVS